MDFLKGPKALISSAIVEALAEYFVVGADHIESNLFVDTKIVLKDARLKPQHSSISENAFGKKTDICVTGFVREVSLTWSWNFMASDEHPLIKDPVLQLEGSRFKVQLTQTDTTNDVTDDEYSTSLKANSDCEQHKEGEPDLQSQKDEQTREVGTIEKKIDAFITKQVQLFVNTLKLIISDCEVVVEMPSPTILTQSNKAPGISVFEDPQEAGNIEIVQWEPTHSTSKSETSASKNSLTQSNNTPGVSVFEDPQEAGNIEIVELEPPHSTSKSETFASKNSDDNTDYTISLKLGFRKVTSLSFGSYCLNNNEILNEKLSISSLFINVTETFTTDDLMTRRKTVCKTYPLLKPFNYSLAVTRNHGERFCSIERGLVVKGGQHMRFGDNTTVSHAVEDCEQILFHFSRPQMEAIGQLSAFILGPQNDAVKEEASVGQTKISNKDDIAALGDGSVFDFSFDSVIVDMMGHKLAGTGISLDYMVDGTNISASVDSLRYVEAHSESKQFGTSITFSSIAATLQPRIEVSIGSITELYVPYVVKLRAPIENVEARLVGEAMIIALDSFDGYLPAHEVELEGNISTAADAQSSADLLIPFPMICKAKRVRLVKEDDEETEVGFGDVEILINPKNDVCSTELACSIKCMNSKLANADNINACMVIPMVQRDINTIRDFALSLDGLCVTAGYTVEDWKRTFRAGGKWKKNSKKVDDTADFKIPYASIGALKTKITYNAMRVVSLKETTFRVKPYTGNEDTTLKHLLDFYATQCLSRTPDFLRNAELLGINVNKAGAFSLVTLGVAGHIAPIFGVAAVVGVDAVRGSIEAGKRSRRAKEGEAAKAGDFFRGIGYSAIEATRRGKLRRGCQDGRGNVIDWMVGATVNTGDYIGKNKDQLGSAGGAGAGVMVGTMLGGPVGAVIGGVIGGVTSGTAIRQIDKRIKNAMNKRDSKYEEKRLKPGQLALSP